MLASLSKLPAKTAQGLWHLSTLGMSKRDDIARYAMYRHIQDVTREFSFEGKVLSISHSNYLCKLIGAREDQIVAANYPDHNLCGLNFADETFDGIVSDQVLEHIECLPSRAINESYRVLKPGGIMVHTTCFMMPFHGNSEFGVPGDGDYWRYTPHGLQLLCEGFSEVIDANGWGNPFMSIFGALDLNFEPVPDAKWHPLHKLAMYNRKSYASVVWIIARK